MTQNITGNKMIQIIIADKLLKLWFYLAIKWKILILVFATENQHFEKQIDNAASIVIKWQTAMLRIKKLGNALTHS